VRSSYTIELASWNTRWVLSAATLGTPTDPVKPPPSANRRRSSAWGSAGAISGPPQLKSLRK